jgi:hypothetical protein
MSFATIFQVVGAALGLIWALVARQYVIAGLFGLHLTGDAILGFLKPLGLRCESRKRRIEVCEAQRLSVLRWLGADDRRPLLPHQYQAAVLRSYRKRIVSIGRDAGDSGRIYLQRNVHMTW